MIDVSFPVGASSVAGTLPTFVTTKSGHSWSFRKPHTLVLLSTTPASEQQSRVVAMTHAVPIDVSHPRINNIANTIFDLLFTSLLSGNVNCQ